VSGDNTQHLITLSTLTCSLKGQRLMTLPWSAELNQIVFQAEAEANRQGQRFSTSHLLLSLCALPSSVNALLRAERIDSSILLQILPHVFAEHEGTTRRVFELAGAFGQKDMALCVSPVHLLQALAVDPHCQAHEMLVLSGFNLSAALPGLHGAPETATRIATNAYRGVLSSSSSAAMPSFQGKPPSSPSWSPVSSMEAPASARGLGGGTYAPRAGRDDAPAASSQTLSRGGNLGARWSPEPQPRPTPPASNGYSVPDRGFDSDTGAAWGETDTADFDTSPPHDSSPYDFTEPPPPPRAPQPPPERLSLIAQKPALNLPRELVERSRSGLYSSPGLTSVGPKPTATPLPGSSAPKGPAGQSKPNTVHPLLRDRTASPDSPALGIKAKLAQQSQQAKNTSPSSPASPADRTDRTDRSGRARERAASSPPASTSPAASRAATKPASKSVTKPPSKPATTTHDLDTSSPPPPSADALASTKQLAKLLFNDRPRAAATPPSDTSPEAIARRALEFDRFNLNPRTFPTLTRYGRNLLAEARDSKLDPMIGREREVHLLIDVLNKRLSNNPVLVGPPGTGKTAIVEGLANLMASDSPPPGLSDRTIIALEYGALLAGTQLRGSFQERLGALKREVERAEGRVVLFLDELHTWLGSGSADGSADAISELKVALARGKLPCIGATTTDEFKRFLDADPAMERRFDPIRIEPPDTAECLRFIQGGINRYVVHHGVRYPRDVIEVAIKLSNRFIPERQQPDKAISVLDRAGSLARRLGLSEVGHEQVAAVISDLARVPTERLLLEDHDRLLRMEEHLSANLIGHADVISRVARTIRRNHAGFASNRPMGSFLLLGPTGVGKTELVKVLADFMFGSREAFVRVDMSEFMEKHSVARLLGAPPGYVGFDEGGQLTEALRRQPYQIVLLDEVEKAHPDVLNILLQLLDEGHLSDGQGRKVNFSNAIIILTSNLGSEHMRDARRTPLGFGVTPGDAALDPQVKALSAMERKILTTAEGAFPPELWNRIEDRLVFHPLDRAQVSQVAALQLRDSARRLEYERGISLTFAPALIPFLIDHGGFDPVLGARPMRQTIQRLVESAIADAVLAQRLLSGQAALIGVRGDEVSVEVLPAR
jgi:ATP-dependent Clp protease ATP-binding subunit ClpC